MRRYGLRDDQWDRIKDFCLGVKGTWAARRKIIDCLSRPFSTDLELGVPGVIYPSGLAIGKRSSTFQPVGEERGFRGHLQTVGQRSRNEYMIIDATIVRAINTAPVREKNGAQAIGRSRGGLTTKIHVLVDALGNPFRLMLTPGQDHDLTGAEPLLETANPRPLSATRLTTPIR